MENWSREKTVNLILKIEQNERLVNSKVDGILIWPWVRVKLFFFFLEKFEARTNTLNNSLDYNHSNKFKSVLKYLKEYLRIFLVRKGKFLFVGASSHREVFSNKSYNKFFDPFRSKNLNSDGILIEYSNSTDNAYLNKKNFSFNILKMYAKYFFKPGNSNTDFWLELQLILDREVFDLNKEDRSNFINKLKNKWSHVRLEAKIWRRILKILKPSKIFTLCYYSSSVYSLNLAAHELKIPTIELQHGPVNKYHLAYGSFDKIGHLQSSALIPDQFLVWDSFSLKVLLSSFPLKKTNIIGLPWFSFLNQHSTKSGRTKRKIIYALQPISEIGELFPKFLISWIKESKENCLWQIRMHPRQFNERDEIKRRLKNEGVDDIVDLDSSSNSPLPTLLANSDLVFTNFSGVVIEAGVMGVPSVTFHPNALIYFSNQLEAKNMFYFDRDLNLKWDQFSNMLDDYFDKILDTKYASFEIFDKLYNTDK